MGAARRGAVSGAGERPGLVSFVLAERRGCSSGPRLVHGCGCGAGAGAVEGAGVELVGLFQLLSRFLLQLVCFSQSIKFKIQIFN